MRKVMSIRSGWGVLLGTGLFLISLSFTFRFARDELIQAKQAERKLKQLQELIQSTDAQREVLETLAGGEAVRLEQLLQEVELKGLWQIGEPIQTPLTNGYRHQQVTVELNAVDPVEIPKMLRLVENAQPPWRVVRMELEAVEGTLQGALQLEVLDKPSSMP
jgi:hypothetical protein